MRSTIKKNTWVEPTIAAGAVLLLLMLSYRILAPFLVSLVWAGILVYATWQPYEWLTKQLRGYRTAAAVILLISFALLILVPLVVAGIGLSSNLDDISAWLHNRIAAGLPELPHWIAGLPWLGPKVEAFYAGFAAGDPEVINRLKEWLKPVGHALLTAGAAIGSGMLLMLLSLLFAFFFYLSGHAAVQWLLRALQRIGGVRAQELMLIAGGTIRGVIYGFLGTAFVQGLLAWFGYWISGVPNSPALGLVSCFLSLLPAGPSLLGLPVALWLYQQGHTGWAIFLAAWMVGVVAMADNVVKPLFIGKESDLPFVLILIGVMGGALAWGLIGVFLGPTLLAVSYTLLQNWTRREHA